MGFYVRVNERSINHYGEELCGDEVDIVRTENSDILILSDGLGSGVKANILATMSVKIIGTLLRNGENIDDVVETVIKTLPVCAVRGVAYSTFSILQIFDTGEAYLIEYENPSVLFYRDGKRLEFRSVEREVNEKIIKESRFHVQAGDYFVLLSDGVLYCSPGRRLNMDWNIDAINNYITPMVQSKYTARDIAVKFIDTCNQLYGGQPGDDTTIMVCKIEKPTFSTFFIGPPMEKGEDEFYINRFMDRAGLKIICGGSTANMFTKHLGIEAETIVDPRNTETPPIARMEGVNLVTEGFITMSKVLERLEQYKKNYNDDYLKSKDYDAASMILEIMINRSSHIHFMVGQAENAAYRAVKGSVPLYMKIQLMKNVIEMLKDIGREVTVEYF